MYIRFRNRRYNDRMTLPLAETIIEESDARVTFRVVTRCTLSLYTSHSSNDFPALSSCMKSVTRDTYLLAGVVHLSLPGSY